MENTDTIVKEEEIPRYVEKNHYNYTPLEIAERKKHIRDAVRDYPHLPPIWVDWAYDMVKNMPEDELKDIINNKKWEGECKRKRDSAGGIIPNALVIDSV